MAPLEKIKYLLVWWLNLVKRKMYWLNREVAQYGRKTAVASHRTAVSSGLRIPIQLQFLVFFKVVENCSCILEKNPVTEVLCVFNFKFTAIQKQEITSENTWS